MDWAYNLGSNSTPVVKKFQVGATFANAGILAKVAGAGVGGPIPTTTTACANSLGLALEAVTIVTTQPSDGTDAARMVSIIMNPDAVIRARCSGAATDGTAITDYAETSGDTNGKTVTASGLVSADEGMFICSSGANFGQKRKNITGGSGSAVAQTPFRSDIAVGDKFFTLPFSCADIQTVKLTTLFTEVDQSAGVATNEVAYQPIEVQTGDSAADILVNTYVLLVASDHLFASS